MLAERTRHLALLSVASFALLCRPTRAAAGEDTSASCADRSEKAQRAHLEHHLLEAQRGFRACAQSSCARFIRADCERELRDVEDKVPTVVIAVRTDRGDEVTDARVWVDGAPTNYLRGVGLELDPGIHTVLTRSGSGGEGTAQIVAREGEKDRIVSLVVPRASSWVAPPPVAPRRTAEKILGGVGLGLVLASVAFDIAAYSRYHALSDSCGGPGNCATGEVDTAADLAHTGDALLGVGLATVAAGIIVYLVRGPSAPPSRAASLLSFPLPE